MPLTRDILKNLEAYVDAEYAALRGESPKLGVVADPTGQEQFAADLAELKRKDELLERQVKEIEFRLENPSVESESANAMTISIVEQFDSTVVIAGTEQEVSGARTHVFDIVRTGMGNWLITGHRAVTGDKSKKKEEKTLVYDGPDKEKKSWKSKQKEKSEGFGLHANLGQIAILALAVLVIFLLLIPYSKRVEVCLETGAQRKSLKIAGMNLSNSTVETDLSKWIAAQGATPTAVSWALWDGREGRLFGSKLERSSRAVNALKILETIRSKGDAGKDLLLQYQDIQRRRGLTKHLAGLSAEEKQTAIADATAASKEYLQFMATLDR